MDRRCCGGEVVFAVRLARPLMPIYLSTKAAQLSTQSLSPSLCIAAVMEEQHVGESFTLVSLPEQAEATGGDFERAYRARTGSAPGTGAFEAYEAVRLTAAGLRAAGLNRVLLRLFCQRGKVSQRASASSLRFSGEQLTGIGDHTRCRCALICSSFQRNQPRSCRYLRIAVFVELSCFSSGSVLLSSCGMIFCASTLPSSTPH
jgi:hypothetical protein